MKKTFKQQGYLIIVAAILIVIFGFIVVTVTTMSSLVSHSSNLETQSARAFYLADAGLEYGFYQIWQTPFSSRTACGDLDTTQSLGDGEFNILGTHYYSENPATLTSAITDADTTIPISSGPSTSDYADKGRVLIDHETIDYNGIGTTSGECGGGTPPCLTNAIRGVNSTTAVSHAINTKVGQSACQLNATGGSPDVSDPTAKRIVQGSAIQMEEGWLVTNRYSNNRGYLGHWNGQSWADDFNIRTYDIKGVNALSYADVWAVGDDGAGDYVIARWDGSGWDDTDYSDGYDTEDIYCTSGNYCWIVGQVRATAAPLFLNWNGSIWAAATPTAPFPNVKMNAANCTSSSNCLAVGDEDPVDPYKIVVALWNGASWSRYALASKDRFYGDLYDVDCIDGSDCWMVGADWVDVGSGVMAPEPIFFSWNGSKVGAGSTTGMPAYASINGISCVDTDNCWAVGDTRTYAGTPPVATINRFFAYWDGSRWRVSTAIDASVPNVAFNKVHCASLNNCWAVGNSGALAYWDGTSWYGDSTYSSYGFNINDIALLADPDPKPNYWEEGEET